MKIEFSSRFTIDLPDNNLSTILKAFCQLLSQLLGAFINKILLGFSEYYIRM